MKIGENRKLAAILGLLHARYTFYCNFFCILWCKIDPDAVISKQKLTTSGLPILRSYRVHLPLLVPIIESTCLSSRCFCMFTSSLFWIRSDFFSCFCLGLNLEKMNNLWFCSFCTDCPACIFPRCLLPRWNWQHLHQRPARDGWCCGGWAEATLSTLWRLEDTLLPWLQRTQLWVPLQSR